MTAWNLTARQGLAMIVRAKKEFLTSCFAGRDPTCGAELLRSCPTTSSSDSNWLTHSHSFGIGDLVNAPHANM